MRRSGSQPGDGWGFVAVLLERSRMGLGSPLAHVVGHVASSLEHQRRLHPSWLCRRWTQDRAEVRRRQDEHRRQVQLKLIP
jgi:hypothetical protein